MMQQLPVELTGIMRMSFLWSDEGGKCNENDYS